MPSNPREEADFGRRLAGVEDVNGDAVPDIVVEDPPHGQVLVFSGADGALLYTLEIPSPQAAADPGRPRAEGQALFLGNSCVERTKYVRAGGWRTLETLWRAEVSAFFRAPAGAQIKVRHGVGWFGWDRQRQTLDGATTKTLSVGKSVILARMQMKVTQSTSVTYTYCAVGP